jgi:hypothetical protein
MTPFEHYPPISLVFYAVPFHGISLLKLCKNLLFHPSHMFWPIVTLI